MKEKLTLVKLSSPGWEKEFSSVEACVEELEKWVCSLCWRGEPAINPPDYCCMGPEDKLRELLCTACGYEFDVEGFDG